MTEEMRYTVIGEANQQAKRWDGRVPALSTVRAWLRQSLGFDSATTADAKQAAKLLRQEWKQRRNPARKLKGKSTTLKNMASVTIQKLPNGVVKITGRKMAGKGRKKR